MCYTRITAMTDSSIRATASPTTGRWGRGAAAALVKESFCGREQVTSYSEHKEDSFRPKHNTCTILANYIIVTMSDHLAQVLDIEI